MNEIEPGVFIGGQIVVADLGVLAAAGVRTIVNNRPDHEERWQPLSEDIGGAARDAGIAYVQVPIAGGIPVETIAAVRAALASPPVLLFCKSGMRSAVLWALARAADGFDPDWLIAAAARAGHDLRAYPPMLAR